MLNEKRYLKLLRDVLLEGEEKEDRTGTGTISVFGKQTRYKLETGFPLLTTKKLHWKSIAHELLWFLSGDNNTNYLNDNGVRIWNEWADDKGDLGRIYGVQWRSWQNTDGSTIDQISRVIESLETNPHSRRHIVSAWNVSDLDKMALPPCHIMFQFYVSVDNKLSCHLYQRSADLFLGVPFNIASYSLLTMMIAQVCGLGIGDFVHTLGDAHIYSNHIEQVKTQLQRQPYTSPKVELNKNITNIFDFKYEDIVLQEYEYHPTIKAKVAV